MVHVTVPSANTLDAIAGWPPGDGAAGSAA
jgi:hypothetical protein